MRSAIFLFVLAASLACATSSKSSKSTVAIKPSDIHQSLGDLDKRNPFGVERFKVEIEKTGVKKYDDFLTEAAAVKGSVVVTNVVLEDIEVGMSALASPPTAPATADKPAAGTKPADAKPKDADGKPADTKPADAKPADAKPADAKISEKAPSPVADYDALGNAVSKKRGTFDPSVVSRIHSDVTMLDALVGVMKALPDRAHEVATKGQGLAQAAGQELTKDPFGMASVPGALSGAIGQVTAAAADAPATITRSANVIKAIAICGCSNASEALTPADIAPALGPLYDKNPFANEATRVEHVVTGVADYDAFFKEVAVLRGSAVLIDVWVRDVGATLADIGKAPIPTTPAELQKLAKSLQAKKTKPNGDVVGKLKNHVAQLTAIIAALAAAPIKAKDLTAKAQQIGASAAKDVTTSPAAMAGLPGAVEESAKSIVDSGKKAADAIPALKGLAAPLTALAGA